MDKAFQSNRLRIFLSTLSLRRATAETAKTSIGDINFYPRSPCGERRLAPKPNTKATESSIHALLAESDTIFLPSCDRIPAFLSTLSLRRATIRGALPETPYCISIHALLAESDIRVDEIPYQRKIFLSTLSLRRATYAFLCLLKNC